VERQGEEKVQVLIGERNVEIDSNRC